MLELFLSCLNVTDEFNMVGGGVPPHLGRGVGGEEEGEGRVVHLGVLEVLGLPVLGRGDRISHQ